MDDWQLIQEYVEKKSDSAFRVLVDRYTNLVYSAALRQAFEPHLAEEIAQTVFILLTQKAKEFRKDVILPGWLFRTTRFVAHRAVRTEKRRQRRETEAYQMQELNTPDTAWLRMAPCLDEALAQLGETERNAIILRYFQGKELRQVGLALGLSEEAARKRVSRSVEKLRSFFAERGYSISASLMVATLGAHGVKAAPADLAGRLATTALTGGVVAGGFPLVMEVLSAWKWAKLKLVGLGVAGCLATVALITTLMPPSSEETGQGGRNTESLSRQPATAALSSGADAKSQTANQVATTLDTNASVLRFRVLAADNDEPVARAQLTVNTVAEKWIMRRDFFTDAAGWCSVAYPKNIGRLDVGVLSHGWGAKFATWRPANDPIPQEYTMRVERLTNSLGGFLVDAAGTPVADADVFIGFSGTGDSSARETPRERVGFPMRPLSVGKSDANGRWFCSVVPTEHKGFHLEARHPKFSPTGIAGFDASGTAEKNKETLNKLLAGTLVTRMQSAFTLSGQVLDEAGNPIEAASITKGTQQPVYKTDGAGWFQIAGMQPGEWEFTVSAENFSPQRGKVTIGEGMSPLEIRLERGGVLRLKTVDQNGAPVTGAIVSLEQWGEDRHVLTWTGHSDSEGRIEWRSAPRDVMLELCARKNSYCYTRNLKFEAGDQEQVIKMRPSLTVPIRAVVAKTGTTIREFKAYPGYGRDGGNWERLATAKAQDGVAKVTFEEDELPWRVRVEAPGYLSATIKQVSTDDSKGLVVELKPLEQSDVVRGSIFDQTGNAVAGADVALCTIEQQIGVELVKHGLGKANSSLLRKSKSDGAFEFPANPAAHTVVVAHPLGFARLRLPKDGQLLEIVLQPWGRIEGTVHLSESLDNLEVILSDWTSSQYQGGLYIEPLQYSSTVSADGRFVIDPAPPGNFFLSLSHGPRKQRTHKTSAAVIPGQTVVVEMGKGGTDVVGKFLLPPDVKITNWDEQITAHLQPTLPRIERPTGLVEEELKFWEVDFWQSEPGFKRLSTSPQTSLIIKEDGSFRGYGIVPGDYQLGIRVTAGAIWTKTIASHYEKVSIPEQSSDGSKAVLDLGERLLKQSQTRR